MYYDVGTNHLPGIYRDIVLAISIILRNAIYQIKKIHNIR